MKQILLLFCMLCTVCTFSQTIFDFETPETSTNFQTFGGSLEGMVNMPIANPYMSGINTSATVMTYTKAGDAPTWGGAFANPAPTGGIDVTNGGQICIDVWMDHIGIMSLKLETTDPNDPENYRQEVANTVMNAWEQICFDMDANSLDGNMTPATGKMFVGLVIFPDFGTDGGGTDVTYYLDNFIQRSSAPDPVCTTMFDYDTTNQTFQYFGSSLEPQLAGAAANPNPSGINLSDSVLLYTKAGDAQTWAGSFSNPELAEPVDGTQTKEICVKVHWPNAGNLTMKLELAAFDDPENWIQTRDVTTINEWTEVCFDLTEPSFEGNLNNTVGKIYPKMVLFPDFNIAGTGSDVNYYMDDFVKKSVGVTPMNMLTFNLNMNDYTGPFTTPSVFGSFNGWAADANPMEDPDSDGIWSTTVTVPSGIIEYKFILDQSVEESFNGSDACTKTTDDNGTIFVNRELTVAEDTDLDAVCFNSCYDCGASVKITWNLDMSAETVSDLGVYVAGGPFFGHAELPAMTDTDGDGIYTTTIEREVGFSTDYTFLNGICLPAWECKENIEGQDCAVAPFNDRNLKPVGQDTVISTIFGMCEAIESTRDLAFDENLIDVYPSVAFDMVNIDINEVGQDYILNVYNSNGQFQITNQKLTTNNETINVASYATGIYFVQVHNADKIAVKKIIVQ